MQEQTLQPASQEKRVESLSWQYIVLLIAIAALVPLLSSSFLNNVERAEPPVVTLTAPDFASTAYQGLAELPLNQAYEDASGIVVQVPESWHILTLQPGFFVISNHELDLTATEFPPDIVLTQVQIGPLNTFTLADGTAPADGTSARAILESLTAGAQDLTITDLAVSDKPAASVIVEDETSVRQLILITPNNADLVVVDTSTASGMWSNVESLVARIVDSMTFGQAAE